jgi:hypothetical protein
LIPSILNGGEVIAEALVSGTPRIGEGVVGTVAIGVVAVFGVAVGVDLVVGVDVFRTGVVGVVVVSGVAVGVETGIGVGVSFISFKLSSATMLLAASILISVTKTIVIAISIVFLRILICNSVPARSNDSC